MKHLALILTLLAVPAIGQGTGVCNQNMSCRLRTVSVTSTGNALTCATVGCKLSLGNTSRYLTDDGSYFSLSTGLNVAGGNVNVYSASGYGYENVATNNPSDRVNPDWTFWRITSAPVANEVDARLCYSDSGATDGGPAISETCPFYVGNNGTLASVRRNDGASGRGSHFEGFLLQGDTQPVFRLNSYPYMTLEMGAGSSSVTDVSIARSAANTLALTASTLSMVGDVAVAAAKKLQTNTIQTQSASTLTTTSTVAATGSSVGFIFNTSNTMGAGDRIFQIKNNGTLVFSITEAGTLLAPSGIVIGSTGYTITNENRGTATIDFGSIAIANCADSTITVSGSNAGDAVQLGVPNAAMVTGSQFSAWVSSSNTVSVRHCCNGAATCDPASGTFTAWVTR